MEPTTQPVVAEAGSRLLTTQEIETFEALSLEVFGATSRWSTLLKKGQPEVVTETVTEYVPAEMKDGVEVKPEETKTHEVPVYLDRAKKSVKMVQRYFTPETLMAFMLERKKQVDAIKAAIEKIKADKKTQEAKDALAKQVAASVSGGV